MARLSTSLLPIEDETEQPPVPWAALLRAQGLAPSPVPAVGNASPAEAPGQSAEAYAAAAQAERAKGNQDTAGRLTVQATEARTQEQSAQGTPEPATPLAPAAVATPAGQPTPAKPPSEAGFEQKPFSFQTAESTRGDMESPSLYRPLEEPPPYVPPSKTGSFFALALDAMLNKGRNAGRIVGQLAQGDDDYTNYQRRVRAAKDAAAIEASKRRGVLSPEEQALREARLKIAQESLGLRKEQIEAQGDSLELRKEAQAVKNDPAHPITLSMIEKAYANGWAAPGTLDGMSWEQAKSQLNEAGRNAADIAMADAINADAANKAKGVAYATMAPKIATASGISDATQANKLELVAAGQEGKIAAEDRADTREQSKRGEDFMKWYSKEAEKDLAIAKLMDGIDASPGGVAPGMAERFKTWLTDRGISADRVKPYMQKQMILELWARQQSGAAISDTEEVRFAKQAASDPTASEEQINAAYEVMGDVISTWLRTKAAARPQEAGTVAQAAGLNTKRWFGDMPVAATASPTQQPSAPRKPRAPAVRKPTSNVVAADDLEF